MKRREHYKRIYLVMASLVILIAHTSGFAMVWMNCYANVGAHFFVRGNYVLIGLYAMMTCFFYNLFDGFKIGRARTFEIIYSQLFALVCVNVTFYLQLCLIGRWKLMTNVMPMVLLTCVELVAALGWCFLVRWAYRRLYPPRKMLLVYGTYSPDDLIRKIQSREDRYDIQDVVSIEADMEEIKTRIVSNGAVVLTDIPAQLRNEILKFCFEKDIRCYCVPKISDVMIRSAETIRLMDTTLLMFRNDGLSADQRALKRGFDIAASLAAIILTAPVMLIIAACIRLYDGGPAIFKQERLTEAGKVFQIYKFRSMRAEGETGQYVLTRKNDERVTPVGKFIRDYHLDELPQLINILKGDMSIVGPRPECPELAEEYKQLIPQFDYRLKVKAGLTGYAQVYGKYNTTPYDKLKLDLHYIENYSFMLDLKLIILTVKILFQKGNTEGIESWQTSAVPDSSQKEDIK